jgi:hypothetical protein
MDIIDELRQFSNHVVKVKDALSTEEATKNALVLPFFKILGYDVFNPFEFVPEYTADVGTKKDEKVDYAIVVDEKPVILIEAKMCGEPLDKHMAQLFRYFITTPAKFGILTNGLIYNFYTDLNEANKMDLEPFLTIDILDIHENIIPELKRFAKKTLDIEGAFNAAAELKYMGKFHKLLESAQNEPSESFVKYIMSEIYDGRATQKAIDEFRPIIKRGFNQYITDAVNDRLKSAMNTSQSEIKAIPSEDKGEAVDKADDAPMTLEELEAFAIVKAILRDVVDVDRLTWQHTKDYMVILFDNNSRKRICRLWFNRAQKYITTPDKEMKPIRFDISSLNDIYKRAEAIREVCMRYINRK